MAKSPRDRWTLKPHVRVLKRCAADHATRDWFLLEAETLAAEPDANPYDLSRWLRGCGAWPTARGMLAILESNDPAAGASLVCTGWKYEALFQAVVHMVPSAKRLNCLDITRSACCLLFAIAMGRDSYAAHLGEALCRVADLGSKGVHDLRDWWVTPIDRLSLVVYAQFSGHPVVLPPRPVQLPNEPDLASLAVECWHDEDRFPAVLDGLLRNRSATTDTDNDAFDDLCYGLLPIEFLAVSRVRVRDGLATTWPAHPLLATPVARMTWADDGEDLLFARVKARCEARLGLKEPIPL